RPRHHRRSDVHPGAQRHRIPSAGTVNLSRADGGAEHPRDPGDDRHRRPDTARSNARATRRAEPDAAGAGAGTHPVGSRAPPRRAEISRGRVIPRKFILLDEPFAGIDPIALTDIQNIIFHLKARGIGVLITDHNVRATLRITDRAYIVNEGTIFKSGTPDTLAADDEVRRIYLGLSSD